MSCSRSRSSLVAEQGPEARAVSITHALSAGRDHSTSPVLGLDQVESGLCHRAILLARHARSWLPSPASMLQVRPWSCAQLPLLSSSTGWRVLRNRQFMHTRQNLKGIKEPSEKSPAPSASHPVLPASKNIPACARPPPVEPGPRCSAPRSFGFSHMAWEGACRTGAFCGRPGLHSLNRPLDASGLCPASGFPRQICCKFHRAAAVRPTGWKGNA